jgi:hypothetical protein
MNIRRPLPEIRWQPCLSPDSNFAPALFKVDFSATESHNAPSK